MAIVETGAVMPQRHRTSEFDVIDQIKSILTKERRALELVEENIPANAHLLVQELLKTAGRVVFCGSGKSGLIAQKLVATFSSLGIPSFFLHPHEALHGDLGMVASGDFFIALSKSGTGAELSIIVAVLKTLGITSALIACCSGILAKEVDIPVILPFEQEACSLNLAPTSSSTVTLAFGDALAVVTSSLKNYTRNDFARIHPAGALGRQLLLTVGTLMYKEQSLPFINPATPFEEFIVAITEKKMGVGIVVNYQQELLGIITDGDLRRACKRGPSVFQIPAIEVMTKNPKTIDKNELAAAALTVMEANNITSLVVTENHRAIGLLHIHEIIKAGIKGS